ncbi:MAG: hypothetical protein IKU88_04945 [Alistipes sp.]|nr:hypothetical protein [Alistipes sp.]
MTTFVEILSIIVPALDKDAKISIARAEELLITANFDFEEVGYSKKDDPNYIENLFRDLDNGRGIVTIEGTGAGEVMIAYHAECDPFVKVNELTLMPTPMPTPEPGTQGGVPATAQDDDEYNRRVVEYIKAEGVDGRVLISAIGLNIGKVPTAEKGEKMGQYFRRYPELFVVDTLYVTLRGCETGKEVVAPGKVWTMDECEQYNRAVIDYILDNGENRVAHLSKVGHYVGKVPTESTGEKLGQYLKRYPELFDVDTYYVTLKEGAESYQPTPTPMPTEQGEQRVEVPIMGMGEQPAEVEPEQPILGEQPAEVEQPKPVVQPAEVDEPTQREQGEQAPQVARPEQTVQEVQSAKSVQEVAASLYDLDHFAAFDNREAALCELAQLAKPEGWAVLPEGEANRYLMVEAKLRLNFAMAVKELLDGISRDIVIALNAASFDTRFRTPEGGVIIARFLFNRRRSEDSWQQYRFDRFVVK